MEYDELSLNDYINALRGAYHYYISREIVEKISARSLVIMSRYVALGGQINKETPAAAAYIASRHPQSFPNMMTKGEFAAKMEVDVERMDKNVDDIAKKLNMIVLRDHKNYPYFLDRNGAIYSMIDGIVKEIGQEQIVYNTIGITRSNPSMIADTTIDIISTQLGLIPFELTAQLKPEIERKISSIKFPTL